MGEVISMGELRTVQQDLAMAYMSLDNVDHNIDEALMHIQMYSDFYPELENKLPYVDAAKRLIIELRTLIQEAISK